MQWLIGLVGFSLVSAGTPGPNNVLLWASGATFGFRRTMPHVVGTALGIGAMTLAVAAGVGLIVTSLPALTLLMKVAGSAYLLVLAYRIARAGSTEGTSVSRPMNLLEATTFQAVNPKGCDLRVRCRDHVPTRRVLGDRRQPGRRGHDDGRHPPVRRRLGGGRGRDVAAAVGRRSWSGR